MTQNQCLNTKRYQEWLGNTWKQQLRQNADLEAPGPDGLSWSLRKSKECHSTFRIISAHNFVINHLEKKCCSVRTSTFRSHEQVPCSWRVDAMLSALCDFCWRKVLTEQEQGRDSLPSLCGKRNREKRQNSCKLRKT